MTVLKALFARLQERINLNRMISSLNKFASLIADKWHVSVNACIDLFSTMGLLPKKQELKPIRIEKDTLNLRIRAHHQKNKRF